MKKNILVILASLILGAFVFAEDAAFEKVCKQLASHPNTVGDFVQVRKIAKAKRSLTSSGTFIFSLDGIMWKTLKPFPSSIIVGMNSVTQITPDGKKSVLDASNNPVFTSISTTLSAVFSGDAKKLYESFNVNFLSTENTWKTVLSPKDKTIAAVMNVLELNGTRSSTDAEFSSIILTDANGDSTTYTFSNQKYPKELSADEKANFTTK